MATPRRKLSLKSRLVNRLARSSGPVNRLRARRFGLDVLRGRSAPLELYYEPGDPHSHLAAQLLPGLAERLQTSLIIRVVVQDESPIYPEMDKQRRFALIDAQRIAPAWGLQMPAAAAPVPQAQRFAAARMLLQHSDDVSRFVEAEARVSAALFRGEPLSGEAFASSEALAPEEARARLAGNAKRRARLGHYLPGMWQFNGEWFWAVDRFPRLLERLREARAYDGPVSVALRPELAELPLLPSPLPSLEFFFSFRSPYSYLAAVQLRQRLPKLSVPLVVKPVLPMAMRGFRVPAAKRLYILRDTWREARALGIPFGYVCDPIGEGALRCLKAFALAAGVEQQMDFLVSAATAAWSEGVDLATDKGLRWAAERAGLDWSVVHSRLATANIDYAERNRESLFAAGFWGVPSFRMGEFATWGRDRLWMIEELLRRHAASEAGGRVAP